jgi:hypothetical protein
MKKIELYRFKLNKIKEAISSLDIRTQKIIHSKYIQSKQ